MRKSLFVLVAALMVTTTIPAFAELQNVTVGGQIRIRGNWYSERTFSPLGPLFIDTLPDDFSIEQRTKLNVTADFTDDVSAFIELDSYNLWGDSFRGLTDTGTVLAPLAIDDSGSPDVALYQAYIEMSEAWGYPLTFRIGRSEMQHGSEFLVGNNDTAALFRGLSFDGIWGTYANDQFSVEAFWTRLVQNNGANILEDSADTEFMGLYASYTGIEDMSIDGFYYYYRQAITDGGVIFGFTDEVQLHTFGLRFAGSRAQFDWDLNGAYQVGDSGIAPPFDDVSTFAVQGNLGYTFDVEYQPRIFIQGAYYHGDVDDVFGFNRLFSDHEYSEFLGNTDLSNFWTVGGGASAQVTESIDLSAVANYYSIVEDFGTGEDALGVEVAIYATYNYSEDLYFSAGYAHFFVMDGGTAGAFVTANGISFLGGGDDDLNYVFLETGISF